MIRGRLRRHGAGEGAASRAEEQVVEIDPAELSGVFNVPVWLRDIGLMAWLLVGVTLLICGLVWLLTLTQVITVPGPTDSTARGSAPTIVASGEQNSE